MHRGSTNPCYDGGDSLRVRTLTDRALFAEEPHVCFSISINRVIPRLRGATEVPLACYIMPHPAETRLLKAFVCENATNISHFHVLVPKHILSS